MNIGTNHIHAGAACWRWEEADWREPPELLHLTSGDVHIWRFSLDMNEDDVNRWAEGLTSEEHQRLDGIRSPKRKREYVVGRIMLRGLIGKYQGIRAQAVQLAISSSGKPHVISQHTEPRLYVTLSHSGNILLIAVAHQDIGVDVEHLRNANRYPHVAQQIFPPAWTQMLTQAADNATSQALLFTRYWTACESLHKLLGRNTLRDLTIEQDAITTTGDSAWGCHFMASERSMAALTSWRSCNLSFFTANQSLAKTGTSSRHVI